MKVLRNEINENSLIQMLTKTLPVMKAFNSVNLEDTSMVYHKTIIQ